MINPFSLPPPQTCNHDWFIWPETDGQEQKCRECGDYRKTPEEDKYWIRKKESE